MGVDRTSNKTRRQRIVGWAVVALCVVAFVGAREIHPGGIRGLLGDFVTEASSNSKVQPLREKMLVALRPMGAAAICIKEHGENAELREALVRYNNRNEASMKELIASVEAEGGMSKTEKDLLDRQAYREARAFLDGGDVGATCNGLAKRFNSGEFDVK